MAKSVGYQVTLIYFYLDTHDLAIERVKTRVKEGGHNIPTEVIIRRYYKGLKNLFEQFIPICDFWMIFDNSKPHSELIAEGYADKEIDVINLRNFEIIKSKARND